MDRIQLKAAVIALSAASREARALQRQSPQDGNVAIARYCARNDTREAMLAYAFARGVPYRVLEPIVESAPYAGGIAKRVDATVEQIKAWLVVPETPGQQLRRIAARQVWFARRAVARLCHRLRSA